jgi:hypothetical protein
LNSQRASLKLSINFSPIYYPELRDKQAPEAHGVRLLRLISFEGIQAGVPCSIRDRVMGLSHLFLSFFSLSLLSLLVRFAFAVLYFLYPGRWIFCIQHSSELELEATRSISMEQLVNYIKSSKPSQCNNPELRDRQAPEAHGVHLLAVAGNFIGGKQEVPRSIRGRVIDARDWYFFLPFFLRLFSRLVRFAFTVLDLLYPGHWHVLNLCIQHSSE